MNPLDKIDDLLFNDDAEKEDEDFDVEEFLLG